MAHGKLDRNILLFVIPKIVWSLLIFGYACASFVDDQPYCALRYRRLCQGKGRHVGCQYPYPGPGAACKNYTQIKFNARLRHFVISYINRRRQRIAAGTERVRGGALIPKPQRMMMVVWDRELALLAQRLADQCSFIHDDCRATVRYPYAGQTVGEVRWRGAGGGGDALSAQRAVRRVLDAWWGERRRVHPRLLLEPFRLHTKGTAWGHFSQLAVWTLSAAGCGAARHGSARLLLVCDYSHTNMLGQSTLNPGELARCPKGYARKTRSAYPLLCAPVRVPDQAGNEGSGDYGAYEEYVNRFSDDEEDTSNATAEESTKIHQVQTKEPMKSKNLGKKNASKQFILDRLDQELELKTTQYKATKFRKFSTRLDFGDIRENNERDELKSRFKIDKPKPIHPSVISTASETARRKWKNTRQRPRRPGADALLSKQPEKIIDRSTGVSLKLDREDMEQLFRDTGYHKHWKKESLP